jgi:hypothetical protein
MIVLVTTKIIKNALAATEDGKETYMLLELYAKMLEERLTVFHVRPECKSLLDLLGRLT